MGRKAKRPSKAELWAPLLKQATDYDGKPDACAFAVCSDTDETIALIRMRVDYKRGKQGNRHTCYVLGWFGAFRYIQDSPDEFEADELPESWRYRWGKVATA